MVLVSCTYLNMRLLGNALRAAALSIVRLCQVTVQFFATEQSSVICSANTGPSGRKLEFGESMLREGIQAAEIYF